MTEAAKPTMDQISATLDFVESKMLVENPLANYPDTDECLCGSGHIWRRCHKSQMISMIPKDEAEKVQAFMDLKAKGKT